MTKIAALWLKDGEKGKFFVGKLGDATLFVFKNKNKKADNQPDYEVFVAPPKDKGAPPPKKETPKEDDFGF
jgi:hypothetical protein